MYTIGLDLGQKHDFSAIAVVERRERRRAYQNPEFDSLAVRRMERIPLGTPYPRVVDRVKAIAQHPELHGRCGVAVDATGVGAPVVDLLRGARIGCEIMEVTITAGDRAHSTSVTGAGAGPRWNVPKRDLLMNVDVLLERGELRIAKRAPEAGALIREMMDVKSVHTKRGRVRMGADGAGQHDDLVIALALACWRAKQARSGYGGERLMGI